jgi:hypothetical protein
MTTYSHAKPAGTPTWVDLLAPDIESARSFYHAIFDWEYDIAGPEFGGYTIARLGQHPAAGMSGPQPGAPAMPAAWGLFFASDDLAADVARAVALGATVLVPPMVVGPFGGMATCVDPTGAVFSFWQAGQHIGFQVSDEPGATTWYELWASDAQRARDFYAALLGAAAEPMPGDQEYYVLKHGEAMLCGIMQADPRGDLPQQWIPYFVVADIDAIAALITRLGGKLLSRIEDSPFGRFAAVADPSGALFEIIQPPA